MGQFESGKWIIGLIIYFVFFFLIVSSIVTAKNYLGVKEVTVTYNDPGFESRYNIYDTPAHCGGQGSAMNFLGNILCNQLSIFDDNETCNGISGCLWKNATYVFNVAITREECTGLVNLSYYGLGNYSVTKGYCSASGLQASAQICETFKCEWINYTSTADSDSIEETKSPSGIWETMSWIVTFRADLGLGHYSWVMILIFFYVPLVMLIWSIYMALPIIH